MKLDKYSGLDSPVHWWDPRLKLVGLMALALSFAFVTELWLLPAMLAVSLALCAVAKLPFSFLLSRLRYPGIFIFILAVILPFLSGETVLLQLGPLALREEGSLEMLMVVGRFTAIVTLAVILFGTAPVLTTIKAMRALGLPALLADMTLFSYRYIEEIGSDLSRMRRAVRLRGFRALRLNRRNLSVLASLVGSLLVRSYERSDRVYQAMILRGYGQPRSHGHDFRATARDVAALSAVLLVAAGFVAAEVL